MLKWKLLCTALCLLLLPGRILAQSSSIRGTVYRAHHEVEGLRVELSNASIGFARRVTTDSQGGYNFENVRPADGYTLTVYGGDGRVAAVDMINASLQHNPWLPHPAIELTRRFNLAGTLSDGTVGVPGLRLTLLNTILGGARTTQTDASGRYHFDGLPFGNEIEKAYVLQARGLKPQRPIAFALTTQAPVLFNARLLGGASTRPAVKVARNEPPPASPPGAPAPPAVEPGTPTSQETAAASEAAAAAPSTAAPTPAPTAETRATPTAADTAAAPAAVAAAPAAVAPVNAAAAVAAAIAPAPVPALPLDTLTRVVAQNDFDPSMESGISNEQLRLLPLFNRNFLALGGLVAGVHDVNAGSPLQGAAFSISGSSVTSTNFLIDGQDNVASSSNQAIPFQVNEAIQEFRVIYANPGAGYGQASGGVIDVVTNRGASATRALHGSLFGYFNNDALNANSPLSAYSTTTFARAAAYASYNGLASDTCALNPTCAINASTYQSSAPTTYNMLYSLLQVLPGGPATTLAQAGAFDANSTYSLTNSRNLPFSSQQFGGKVGGLVTRRLFLFGSYEGTRINNPTPIYERVPTSADLSSPASVNSGDAGLAQGVLALFPRPNVNNPKFSPGAGVSAPTGTFGFYRGYAPNYTHVHNLLLRPDLTLGASSGVSLRYIGQILNQLHDDTLPAPGAATAYPGNGAERRAQNQSLALLHTHTFAGGHSTNIARLGFTQFRLNELAQDRHFSYGGGIPARTNVLSGVDTRLTGASAARPGLVGGWYDSFWNTCAGAATAGCTSGSSAQSPSAITPSLDGDFPFARIGAPLTAPSARRDTEGEASDAFSFQLGSRNFFNAGFTYRYQQNFDYEGGMARGLVVSNNIGEFTSDSETCISCGEAFLHPSFDYALRQPNPYLGDLRSSAVEGFLEDRIQPSPNLTVTAGLRYEYFGQPLDTGNRLWNYDPAFGGLTRQGLTGSFDPFDYACQTAALTDAPGTTTRLDSIFAANSVAFNSWHCSGAGRFHLPANKHDLSPRLGLAYAPGDSYRDVLRAAVGLYFDHLPAEYNEQLLTNRPTPLNPLNPSALYGQNFYSAGCAANQQCGFGNNTLSLGAGYRAPFQAASAAGPMLERDARHLGDPYSMQLSAGWQHLLGNHFTGELAYIGTFSRHLPLVYDSNYLNEFYCTADGVCDNNTFFPIFTEGNVGSANYHSLVVRLRSEQWHGLTFHASYTFAKSLDDIAGSQFPHTTDSLWNQLFGRQLFGLGNPVAFALGANSIHPQGTTRGQELNPALCQQDPNCLRQRLFATATIPSFDAISSALTTTGSRQIVVSDYSLPQNPLNYKRDDYGRSNFDVRHRGVLDLVYKLPLETLLLRDLALSSILTEQSGQPFTVFSGPAYGQVTQRVNLQAALHTTGRSTQYFANSPAAVQLPGSNGASASGCVLYAYAQLYTGAAGRGPCIGNSARNAFTGPAFFSQDLALQKNIRAFSDEQHFVLRAEFFNLFNHANFYNPISEYSTDGVHINPEFGLIRSAHDPRQMQFAFRYEF